MRIPLLPIVVAAALPGLFFFFDRAVAQDVTPDARSMPVEEVTIFKDGHAMILRRGEVATDDSGNVVLDELPRPVLGTFWAWEDEPGATLNSVVAGQVSAEHPRTPESVREMIEANIGAHILWKNLPAEIVDVLIPTPAPASRPARQQPNNNRYPYYGYAPLTPPVSAAVPTDEPTVLLRLSPDEILAVPISVLEEQVTFSGRGVIEAKYQERRQTPRLTMNLDWDGGARERARVGAMYVELGLRWIPSYKLTILDDSTVRLELQALVINEITDLDGVTANFVIGVPSFKFENTPDPLALQDIFADLGPFFRKGVATTGAAFSNAVMTQVAVSYGSNSSQPSEGTLEVAPPGGDEDLFVFTIEGLTLGKGERASIPLATAELTYERVFTLDVPVSPPDGIVRSFDRSQHEALAEMLARNDVRQVLRLTNGSDMPLTTAPVLIVRDGMPLAQDMIRYTPIGARGDIAYTTAVDVHVETTERALDRDPDGMRVNDTTYTKVEMAGAVTITSYKNEPITLEIKRRVFGNIDTVGQGGVAIDHGLFSPAMRLATAGNAWWHRHYWPWWWSRFNGASMVEWKVTLEPGEPATLDYAYHYFWN